MAKIQTMQLLRKVFFLNLSREFPISQRENGNALRYHHFTTVYNIKSLIQPATVAHAAT